jgi:hypothetical protein
MKRLRKSIQVVKHRSLLSQPPLGDGLRVGRAAEAMGELHFQCPACGMVERVNDIGKMLLATDPSAFTSIECLKCQHRYNARARLQQGAAPGLGTDSW